MENMLVKMVVDWLRNILAVASTAAYGAIVAWLANKGLEIDTDWLRQGLTAVAAGAVLVAEKILNAFVPKLRPVITLLRLGQSLPVYEHNELPAAA